VVNGLVDVLIHRGVVDSDELLAAIEAVRAESAEKGQLASVGAAIRIDGTPGETATVDCSARLHICHAVCCRLPFALSAGEIEARHVSWDLGRPYFNRRNPDGYCHRCDTGTHACGIYDDRPAVCGAYDCTTDKRIWNDFEAMELNHEWIDAHLGGDELGPVEIFMDANAG
jgi:Fe-S-cluster containining protein